MLTQPVRSLGLQSRTVNGLKLRGVHTVGELLPLNKEELVAIRDFGEVSYKDVEKGLRKHGLRLGQKI